MLNSGSQNITVNFTTLPDIVISCNCQQRETQYKIISYSIGVLYSSLQIQALI